MVRQRLISLLALFAVTWSLAPAAWAQSRGMEQPTAWGPLLSLVFFVLLFAGLFYLTVKASKIRRRNRM